ncbi:hypothetical protein CLOM_g23422 [Closterium sp. NIES-68]|nr:hypothetical protein CLOM_g23422 [Closterium sp. NIES-68]GJP61219.1 hypothetical protein CLOP_g18406 [Closterium sp. NIES-67]
MAYAEFDTGPRPALCALPRRPRLPPHTLSPHWTPPRPPKCHGSHSCSLPRLSRAQSGELFCSWRCYRCHCCCHCC